VAGDHSWLVAFGAFAKVFMIDAADIGAAYGGGFDAEEDFPVARLWNMEFLDFGGAVSGQHGTLHVIRSVDWHNVFLGGDCSVDIPEILPTRGVLPEEDMALDESAVPIDFRDGGHFGSGKGIFDCRPKVGFVVARVGGHRNRNLSALDSPFDADEGGVEAVGLRDGDDDRVFGVNRVLGRAIPLGTTWRA
jgi:hypothetical protein